MKTFFIGLVAGAVLALAVVGTWQHHISGVPATVGAAPTKIASEEKKPMPCKTMLVYPDKAKQQLNLPAPIVADVNKQVTASTVTPGNEHAHTVTAVTDLGTGDTELLVKEEPLPWFSLKRSGEASIAYGFRQMKPSTQFEATEYLAHIKALNFGITGQVESQGSAYVGMVMSVDW